VRRPALLRWGRPVAPSSADDVTYGVVLLAVAVGALLPVVPTGAVGAGAAPAVTDGSVVGLLPVLVTAAAGALLGDAALLAVLRRSSRPIRRWYARRVPPEEQPREEQRLWQRPVSTLVLSRLVPAGRNPVILAAG
jgi:membrane protein DedA with SNARE-associated domain